MGWRFSTSIGWTAEIKRLLLPPAVAVETETTSDGRIASFIANIKIDKRGVLEEDGIAVYPTIIVGSSWAGRRGIVESGL